MEAVKATGTINKQGQLTLDRPLDLPEKSRVEVVVLWQAAPENSDTAKGKTPRERQP